jgi:HlyD family secretion protein
VLSSLTDIKVVAPISGLVIQRPVEVGELVISGTATTITGTTILELGDPKEIIIRAAVNEVDIGKIRVGQPVKVEMSAYEDEEFPAKVFRISPIGIMGQGQSIVSFKVEIRFDELSDKFMPGMTCDLDLLVEERENVLTLPHHAIFQEQEKTEEDLAREKKEEEERRGPFGGPPRMDQPEETEAKFFDYVWVKKGDDWEKRKVKLGLKGQTLVEILEGVSSEDKVYPEAERMRWIMEERARKAEKRWFWQKAPKEEEAKKPEADQSAEESASKAGDTSGKPDGAAADQSDENGESKGEDQDAEQPAGSAGSAEESSAQPEQDATP